MLQSFFASKTRLKLLRLFLKNPTRQYYLREISKMLDESLTPIRRELLNLKKIGLLERVKVANLIYYGINGEFLLYDEFKSMIEKTEPDYQKTAQVKRVSSVVVANAKTSGINTIEKQDDNEA